MVILSHAIDRHAHPTALLLGYPGVLLFFAISGFLITRRILDEYTNDGKFSFRNFYIRRAFRILIPATFFLAVYSVLGLLHIVPWSLKSTLAALLFVRNYVPALTLTPADWYNGHFWSLSVEEHFYLLWPAILALAGPRRARWVAPGLALATIGWRALDERYLFIVRVFHAPDLALDWYRTDYVADTLLWGCTLAIWLGSRPWKARLPRGTTSPAALTIIVLIGIYYFGGDVHHGRVLIFLAMTILLGCTVTSPGSLIGQFLELAPVRYIGRLSYSLYLWQQLFLIAEAEPLWFQRFPVNMALIFACAIFSYYLVERRAIRLGRRITRASTVKDVTKPVTIAPNAADA
jgi:peptidoglycan/LPS O-acetylase OafA/YrhL